MSGFTKLFPSIVMSTVWREPNHVRIVWVTMLALADRRGVVEGSVPGLADAARVSLAECEAALRRLGEPDPYSRSPELEGRRIVPVDGGWRLVNYQRYREKARSVDRREYLREKQAESRLRKRQRQQASTPVNTVNHVNRFQPIAEAEAEAEAEKREGANRDRQSVFVSPSGDPLPSRHEAAGVLRDWNELTTSPIPRAQSLTETRIRHIRARLKEHGREGLRSVFRAIEASRFCRGENNRGWIATFDWAIRGPDVAVKALEGGYGNGDTPRRTTRPARETGGLYVPDADATMEYLDRMQRGMEQNDGPATGGPP